MDVAPAAEFRADGLDMRVRDRPRIRVPRGGFGAQNAVRVYRESPESICVQIRMETRLATVSLSFDEAREFVRRILHAVNDTQ